MAQIEAVRALLETAFPKELLEEKDGMHYVPWEEAARAANTIFGVENLNLELVQPGKLEVVPNLEGISTYGYSAVTRVTATVDMPDGSTKTFFRDGQGFNELSFTLPRTTLRNGVSVEVPARAQIDMAIKGAASGSLLRALVLLGDAFGQYLYNDSRRTAAGVENRTSGGGYAKRETARGAAAGDLGKRPSEKQQPFLDKAGYPAEKVATMRFQEWKQALDDYFASAKKGAPTYSRAADLEPDMDNVPF